MITFITILLIFLLFRFHLSDLSTDARALILAISIASEINIIFRAFGHEEIEQKIRGLKE